MIRDEIVGGVWFLKVLFACITISYGSLKLLRKEWLAALVSCITCLIIPGGGILKLNMMLLFFWSGILYRKYFRKIDNHITILTILSLVTFILMVILGYATYEEKVTFDYLAKYPDRVMQSYIVGLSGSLTVVGVCKEVMNKCRHKDVNILLTIGKYTLGIYIVQILFLERLLAHYVQIDLSLIPLWLIDYIITPILGFVLTFVNYALVLLLKRNKVLNLLLFGNQY